MGQWHLVADTSNGFCAGVSVPFLQAGNLCFAVGGHNNDFIDAFFYAGFEEERDIVNHHGIGILARGLSRQSGLFARDAWVNNSFELAQFGFVTEDDGA